MMKKIQTNLDVLEYNINYWEAVIKKQDQKIRTEVLFFPINWREYLHAKRQLERVKKRYGTTEMWEIKDLHR